MNISQKVNNSTVPVINSSTLKSKIILYLLDYSSEALEQIVVIALVYIFVCLSIYKFCVRSFPIGYRLLDCEKFPSVKRVLIVTAHPDDECMFFGPTILSLSRRPNCMVHLLCLSNGNYEKKEKERKEELWKAATLLNIKNENITLINATYLPDDPNTNWKVETVAKLILYTIETLDIEIVVTFDRDGVSQHPNHCAIYYAAASLCLAGLLPEDCSIFTLETVNVLRKYVSIFDLITSILLSSNWFILNWKDVNIIKDAMRQHKSQMVWFRQLYIIFSRYMVINSLRPMSSYDIELEIQINEDVD